MTINFDTWVGKTQTCEDFIEAGPIRRLAATLDDDTISFSDGDPIPPLAHWLYFVPLDPLSQTGPDGHAKRGAFLPPLEHLPRRMWAGSRLSFSGALKIGRPVIRRSSIVSINEKSGSAGSLVFVTVRNEISEKNGSVLITDEHDIVYRGAENRSSTKQPGKRAHGPLHRSLIPDSVLLFRYSALTFNSHKIHYDHEYTVKVEGYPGLVVHGPLTATLLLDLVRRNLPEARIASFEFRARWPLFAGNRMHVNASEPDSRGMIELWASDAEDRTAMTATMRVVL